VSNSERCFRRGNASAASNPPSRDAFPQNQVDLMGFGISTLTKATLE